MDIVVLGVEATDQHGHELRAAKIFHQELVEMVENFRGKLFNSIPASEEAVAP